MLRLVNGLAAPDSGTGTVAGDAPARARSAKWFGMVPQSPALLPWRTVRANITLLQEVNRRGPVPIPVDVDHLVDAVGLRGFENALPGELSGGMQQRVSLARAFALGAPFLLMDEPFAALDEITREEMRFLLADVWNGDGGAEAGRTVIFVTHSIEEAVTLADRVVVLSARPGRVIDELVVDLPRPRRSEVEDSDAFVDHVRHLRHALRRAYDHRRPGAASPLP
jgi:NitT/TauT family transport system ATP-binding protein